MPRKHKSASEALSKLGIQVRHLELDDPTNYFKILKALRAELDDILETMGDVDYIIGAASGTPQMHACWALLAASGEIPARILQVRPPRFVTEDLPAIHEIDSTDAEFPTIRSRLWADVDMDDEDAGDPSVLIERLGIVGDHPAMAGALETASLLARSDVPVLILGESGTGKEKVAGLVHQLSDRASGAFVPVNCASIPEQLAESILFGHVKGAFTGATRSSEGKFAAAHGGTLFLDEVGELSNGSSSEAAAGCAGRDYRAPRLGTCKESRCPAGGGNELRPKRSRSEGRVP